MDIQSEIDLLARQILECDVDWLKWYLIGKRRALMDVKDGVTVHTSPCQCPMLQNNQFNQLSQQTLWPQYYQNALNWRLQQLK